MNRQIRKDREELGWTLDELARRCGVPPEEVARWEEGSSSPSPFDIARVFAVFHDGTIENLRNRHETPRPEARP